MPPMSLTISTHEAQGVTVVEANGRIVFGEESNALRREVKPLVQAAGPIVVMDLSQVSYMDSGGIGALVGLYTTARAAGGQFTLAGANPKVLHVLEITKLKDVLGMYPTAEDAVSSLRRSATA
jgi:anti-sigma B factor antagonist